MSAGFRRVPLTAEIASPWDRFAGQCRNAWFWQTTTWVEWAEAIAGTAWVEGHSFAVLDAHGEIAGICPLQIEQRDGMKQFAFLGAPLPAPAFREGLPDPELAQVRAIYLDHVAAIARERGVAYGWLKLPFTATFGEAIVNPWMFDGYFDLPYLTQVVDLRLPEEALWRDIRKGHRSDIKRAQKNAHVTIWTAQTLTEEKCRAYQDLHAKDAGRATRSQRTFDMMAGWIRAGHAILAETHVDGQSIAFAVLICYKTGAFYASGCRDPERPDVPGSHLLQWEVIRWLKANGFTLYDVGLQFAGPQWFNVPSAKEASIAIFKRGFGGLTVPLVTAERFYDHATLARMFSARVRALAEAAADAS